VQEALSSLAAAKRRLQDREIEFENLFGYQAPKRLRIRVDKNLLPRTMKQARSLAMNGAAANASRWNATAASHEAVGVERSWLPRINLVGRADMAFDPDPNVDRVDDFSVLLRARVPIFDMTIKQKASQARAEALRKSYEAQDIARSEGSAAASLFSARKELMTQISALSKQAKAAESAVSAMIIERKIGLRTTLDLLQTAENVTIAKVDLEEARFVADRAAFDLLGRIGSLGPFKN